jgi:lanosterol synthase
VDSLLEMQNPDGGFGSYEKARGSEMMEHLNPAEVFDRIMVEYSYPECSTAVLTSLSLFRTYFPAYRRDAIQKVITGVTGYIINAQRPDGSWYGSWAICFTYGKFFALESLASVGQTYQTSARVRRACDWLVSKQMEDGGWGEHYSSCEVGEYVQHEKSQVVNTAWATLALMSARYPRGEVVEKGLQVRIPPLLCPRIANEEGVQLIKSRQLPNGGWLQENIEGVFNRTW